MQRGAGYCLSLRPQAVLSVITSFAASLRFYASNGQVDFVELCDRRVALARGHVYCPPYAKERKTDFYRIECLRVFRSCGTQRARGAAEERGGRLAGSEKEGEKETRAEGPERKGV